MTTDPTTRTLDLNAFGFDKVQLPADLKPREMRALAEGLERVCESLGLSGVDRKSLGQGAILLLDKRRPALGDLGSVDVAGGTATLRVPHGMVSDVNSLAKNVFHMLDQRLYAERHAGSDPSSGKRLSAEAYRLPTDDLAKRVVAEFGPVDRVDEQRKAVEQSQIKRQSQGWLGRTFGAYLEKMEVQSNGFHHPDERLARSFAYAVSGYNPNPRSDDVGTSKYDLDDALGKIAATSMAIAKGALGRADVEAKVSAKVQASVQPIETRPAQEELAETASYARSWMPKPGPASRGLRP